MDNSKPYQTELSYSNGAGIACVNIFTGRLLYEHIGASIGKRDEQFIISPIYNSNFELIPNDILSKYNISINNYMSKGWKLNVHQVLFHESYSDSYFYIDERGQIHEFKKTKDNEYNDTSNLGYILKEPNYEDNFYIEISDVLKNKLYFEDIVELIKQDENGEYIFISRITKIVYADGNEVIFTYSENDNKLEKICSNNSETDYINFKYNNDNLLNKIEVFNNGIEIKRLKYNYNNNNLLEYISEENKIKRTFNKKEESNWVEKITTIFNYKDSKLQYVVSKNSENGFKFDYNNNKIEKITDGKIALQKYTQKENLFYFGDDLYFGEDNYLGEMYDKHYYYIDENINSEEIISKSSNSFIYNKNNTIVTNERNISLCYFFNTYGELKTIFEKVGENLKSLSIKQGIYLSTANDTLNNKKIDNLDIKKNTIFNTKNNTVDLNLQEGIDINSGDLIYGNYICSFYLKINNASDIPFINGKVEYSDEDVYEYYYTRFDGSAVDTWQEVQLPFTIKKINYNDASDVATNVIKNLKITLEDENIDFEFSNIRIYKSSHNQVFFKNKIPLETIRMIKYTDEYNSINMLSSSDYITYNDLLMTIISKTKSNDEEYILYYNNGKQFKLVKSVTCYSANENDSIENQFTYSITLSKQQISADGKTTITSSFFIHEADNEIKEDYIEDTVSIKHCYYDLSISNEELQYHKSWVNKYTLSGKPILTKNENEVITSYESTNSIGQETNTVTITDKNLNQIKYTNFINSEGDIYSDEVDTLKLKYNDTTDLLEEENLNEVLIKKYYYDDYNNFLKTIKFGNTNDEILHNFTYANDKLIKITDKFNSYFYKYDNKDVINTVIDERNNTILFSQTNNIMEDYSLKINSQNNGISSSETYDKYNRIKEVVKGDYKYVYEYLEISESNFVTPLSNIKIYNINNNTEVGYVVYEYDELKLLKKFTYKINNDIITMSKSNEGYVEIEHNNADNNASLYDVHYISKPIYSPNKFTFNSLIKDYCLISNTNMEDETNSQEDADKKIDMSVEYVSDDFERITCKKTLLSGDKSVRKKYEYLPNSTISNTKFFLYNNTNETNPDYEFSYQKTYDNITLRTKRKNENAKEYVYKFDTFNRLTEEQNLNNFNHKKYYYKLDGNVDRITDVNEITKEEQVIKTFLYEKNKLTSVTDSNNDQLLTLIYNDSNLSLCRENNIVYKYIWNNTGKLSEIKKYNISSNTNDISSINDNEFEDYVKYELDYFNNRIKKVLNQKIINYYYNGSTLLWEEQKNNNSLDKKIVYIYDQEGISGFVKIDGDSNITKYCYVKDILGNIISITDGNSILATYEYDAWGNHKVYDSTGNENNDPEFIGNINPFRYRGYYYDVETNLFLVSSRYYSPELCRWISPDDIEYLDPESVNGLNLYCYCLNDPVNYVDPDGHFPVLAAILCGLAIVGMGLTIGGVASDNNTMTAIGLTMVAIPAMISGVGALFSGATYLSIIGGVTAGTGLFTGLFATAEYQEAFTGNNWMLDAGMSEEWYNRLMLTTAAIATAGTIASSVLTSIGNVAKPDQMINSISKNPNRWKQVKEVKEAATGRKYRGGTSYYRNYINKWTGAKSGSHIIIRNGKILHKLHYHLWIG